MSDDLTAPELESETELAFEGALRPRTLSEFVGQAKVRGQLQLLLTAARGWEDMLLGEQTTKRAQTLAGVLKLKLEVG